MAECEWLPVIEFCINLGAGKMPQIWHRQIEYIYIASIYWVKLRFLY